MKLMGIIAIKFAQYLDDISVRIRPRECVASAVKTEDELFGDLGLFRPLETIAHSRRHSVSGKRCLMDRL